MKASTHGSWTIDGVALGQTRSEVESVLGLATTNANPAWARYYRQGGPCRPGPIPVLVSFHPTRSDKDAPVWTVRGLCGSRLCRPGSAKAVLGVGDSASKVRTVLGSPDSSFGAEPGFSCLVYGGCTVTIDDASSQVVEVSLQLSAGMGQCEAALEGALAC